MKFMARVCRGKMGCVFFYLVVVEPEQPQWCHIVISWSWCRYKWFPILKISIIFGSKVYKVHLKIPDEDTTSSIAINCLIVWSSLLSSQLNNCLQYLISLQDLNQVEEVKALTMSSMYGPKQIVQEQSLRMGIVPGSILEWKVTTDKVCFTIIL